MCDFELICSNFGRSSSCESNWLCSTLLDCGVCAHELACVFIGIEVDKHDSSPLKIPGTHAVEVFARKFI